MPKKFFLLLPAIIFFAVLEVYFLANPHPSNLFRHFVFMADSFLHGHFDILNPTWDLGDKVIFNNKTYFQFGPAPAFVLLPLVYLWKTNVSQTYVSMIIGSLNAVLVFILLGRLNISGLIKKLLLTVFFAFGTIHFSAAATGTTWFLPILLPSFFFFWHFSRISEKKGHFYWDYFLVLQSLAVKLPFYLSLFSFFS